MLYPLSYEGAQQKRRSSYRPRRFTHRGPMLLRPAQAGPGSWAQSLLSLVYGVVMRTRWMPKSTRTATSCSMPTTEPSP